MRRNFIKTKKALAGILSVAMLVGVIPVQMLSASAQKTTVSEDTSIISNGTFNTDLNGWTDKEGVFSVDAMQGNVASGSLKIEHGEQPSKIRTDVNVVAGVAYDVSYWVNSATKTDVQANIYEYTFDNKIVAKHEVMVEGATDGWKQGNMTFTATEKTDSIGLNFVVTGETGTVYVDDVVVMPKTTAQITNEPDDCNGDGVANTADVVHMKKAIAKPENYQVIAKKFADRNGDGKEDANDLVTLHRCFVGDYKDDSTYAKVTENAEGVKLQPILGEQKATLSGGAIKSSEKEAEVLLAAANFNVASGDGYTYFVTNENYGKEHFELSFDIEEGTDPRLGIGIRTVCELDYWSSKGAKTGVFLVLHSNFIEVNGFNVNDSNGLRDIWYNPMLNEPVTLSGKTTIAFDVKEEGEKTVLYLTTTTGGKTYQVSVDITGVPNEEGRFAVWNPNAEEFAFDYCIGKKQEEEKRDIAYLTTGGTYTNEAFVFATDLSYAENEKLYVGARVAGEVTRNVAENTGLIMGFDGNNVEVSVSDEMIASAEFVLDKGVEYKFFTKVSDGILTVSAYDGIYKVASAEFDVSGVFVPEQGDFVIWSSDECRDVLYSTMPQSATSERKVKAEGESEVVEITTPSGNIVTDFAKRGYLAIQGNYAEERFEFTTAFDASSPNLGIGIRVDGASGTDYAQDGIFIRLYSNFVEVYQQKNMALVGPSVQAGTAFNYNAAGTALNTGIYTFAVELQEANGTTYLFFEIYDADKTMVCQKTIAVASANIPASGNFVVWSGNASQEIAYKTPYMDYAGADILIGTEKSAGTYVLNKPSNGNAMLGLIGDYTEEYAEFTTTITDKTAPKLVLGARVGGYSATTYGEEGLYITFGYDSTNHINFYQIYANGWGSTATAVSGPAAGHVKFVDGETYTFGLKVAEQEGNSKLTLLIYQEDQVLLQTTFETSTVLPNAGNFVIWSAEEERVVSYEMPKQIENIGNHVRVTGDVAGNVRLVKNGNYSVLEVADSFTKEEFVFTTDIGEVTDSTPYMYIGARRSAVNAMPTSGSGVVIGLYKNFYCIYAPAFAEQVNALNYRVGNVNMPLEAGTYTFSIRMGDTGLEVSIAQEGGWTHTHTFDLSAHMEKIPNAGSFAIWCTDVISDIEYQAPKFTNVVNPIALYANSTLSLAPYAYSGPSNGIGQPVATNYQTEEQYETYYDAGMRTVLMDGNDAYESYLYRMMRHGEDLETAKLNANLWNVKSRIDIFKSLDESKQKHLNLIVFDAYLEYLSRQTTALYGADGSLYASKDALKADVREAMKGYLEQTEWKEYILGVALKDEPSYSVYQAYNQVTEVIVEVAAEYGWEDFYIHTELLPYSERSAANALYDGKNYGQWNVIKQRYEGATTAEAQAAYQVYLEAFAQSASYAIGFDNYPFNQTLGGSSKYLTDTYLYNLQAATQNMKANGKQLHLTLQSHGSTYLTTPTEAAIRYQINMALAFGVKNIRYYTYWYFPGSSAQTSAIIGRDGVEGEKDLYTEVQNANADALKLSKAILNFEYVKSACVAWNSSLHANLTSSALENVTATATQCTLINEMRDSTNQLDGYMVVNATNPIAGEVTDDVVLTFSGYDYATYYVNGEPIMVALHNGVLELSIPSGEGVFVIPHN